MTDLEFPRCPVCGTPTKKDGKTLLGDADMVTWHIVGCTDDHHSRWIQEHASEVDRTDAPLLARTLRPAVDAALQAAATVSEDRHASPLDLLRALEIRLHSYVRHRLVDEYGESGEEWLVKGVPLQIRQDCAQRRESDPKREHPFFYTYLIDLRTILDKNWNLFEAHAKAAKPALAKKELLEAIQRANEIRNCYAHPIRSPQPGTPEFQRDLSEAHRLRDLVCGLTTTWS